MPPSVAAVGPLVDFMKTLCDPVKDFLKAQNFTEWSQIAFCVSGSKDMDPVDEFAKVAGMTPGTRAYGDCRALFTKACYHEWGMPSPPGFVKNPTTPPAKEKPLALIDARSPLEKGVDGTRIYLENPHHTTDQGYCMTTEYWQQRYDALKSKVYWLPPNKTPSKRFMGILLRHMGQGFFEAPKWRQIQSERYATPETKQVRQVGHSNMYVLPEMKEPTPSTMEHTELQIEVCMNGLYMAEVIPHYATLKAFMVYFWHNVHRHQDHDAPPGCRQWTVKEVHHSWETFLQYLETQSRLLHLKRPADYGAKDLVTVVLHLTPASELTDKDVHATIAPKFNALTPYVKPPPREKGRGKGAAGEKVTPAPKEAAKPSKKKLFAERLAAATREKRRRMTENQQKAASAKQKSWRLLAPPQQRENGVTSRTCPTLRRPRSSASFGMQIPQRINALANLAPSSTPEGALQRRWWNLGRDMYRQMWVLHAIRQA